MGSLFSSIRSYSRSCLLCTNLELPLQPAAKALEDDGVLALEPADVDSRGGGGSCGVGGKHGDLRDEAGFILRIVATVVVVVVVVIMVFHLLIVITVLILFLFPPPRLPTPNITGPT